MGGSQVKKGKRGEMEVVNLLRETGVDETARRDPASGGGIYGKSDVINSINYNIEVKRQERLNIWTAIDQVEEYSAMNHAIPSVFFKRSRMTEWWVAIPFREWGKLIIKTKETKTPDNNAEFYRDLVQFKRAMSRVMRHIRD